MITHNVIPIRVITFGILLQFELLCFAATATIYQFDRHFMLFHLAISEFFVKILHFISKMEWKPRPIILKHFVLIFSSILSFILIKKVFIRLTIKLINA